jgi:ankyrin repeat protein
VGEGCQLRNLMLSVENVMRAVSNEDLDYLSEVLHFKNQSSSSTSTSVDELNSILERILIYASINGLVNVVKFLHEKGVEIDKKEKINLRTPLLIAIEYGHLELATYLLENGADINKRARDATAQCLAIQSGKLEVVKFVFERDREKLQLTDERLAKYLQDCVVTENYEVLNYLLEEIGVDINLRNKKTRETALITAVRKLNLKMVTFLLENGADLTLKTAKNESCLHIAISPPSPHSSSSSSSSASLSSSSYSNCGTLEMVKVLVERGVEINAQSTKGNTALSLAIFKGSLTIVKYLVENGADLNWNDKAGETLLLLAAKYTALLTPLNYHLILIVKYFIEIGF